MPSDPERNATDADRERCVEILRHAHARSRFDADELSVRLATAETARTLGELEDLTADLPEGSLLRSSWSACAAVTAVLGLMWFVAFLRGGEPVPWFLALCVPWAAVLLVVGLVRRD
ncbi:hypothetical protein GCM10022221_46330 [Actinocorallia aurea]